MTAEWKRRKISEVATHSLGKMLDKAKNKGEPHRYLRNLNVRWFEFDLSDLLEMRFLPEEEARYTVAKGDVVVCEGGYPGRAAIWEMDEPIHFQKALHRVRFHEPERAPWFLYYLYMKDLDGSLRSHFNGAGIQHFTGEALAQFEIPLPPLEEQHRIVALLDEAFAGIATAKANAEKSLRNAREVTDGYMHSVFSLESDVVELGSVFQTVTGGTPPKSEAHYYGKFMPFVKPPELCDGDLDSAADGLTELGVAVARTLPPHSVLVSCIGTLGKVGLNTVPIACNQQINAILPDASKAVPKFMFFQALSRSFKGQLENLASGTTVPIVNKSKFNSIRVALPPLAEQELIVGRLEALREEVSRLESLYTRKLAALDELKQSLLHQAFSGQL